MLTCIACTKQLGGGTGGGGALHSPPEDDEDLGTPSTRHAIKALTSQIKDMALKASGAYRHCKSCSGTNQQHRHSSLVDSDVASGSERFQYSYRRAGESSSSTPREMIMIGKETDGGGSRMGMSSGEGTPSMSGRTEGGVVFVAEENKEWVAQVEPGVLITFLSLPQGGNDLRRIRFSREMFNKWQAQKWWAENYDKVMELYNVQRFNRETTPVTATPKSDDGNTKIESAQASPVTPPLTKERLPRNLHHPMNGVMGYSSSDSLDHQSLHAYHHNHSNCLASTPKLSSISGAKMETSSMDASARTTSSSHEDVERSGELSMSNASDRETEWVEQDEPGVYITIGQLPGGVRELRRVRFSRERFGEMHARLWWEENRVRIHEQYL